MKAFLVPALLAAAGCAAPGGAVGSFEAHAVLEGGSFLVAVGADDEGPTLTVGHGGEGEPAILLEGKPVELDAVRLSGFGLYFETVYRLTRTGEYEVRRRKDAPDDQPRDHVRFRVGPGPLSEAAQ